MLVSRPGGSLAILRPLDKSDRGLIEALTLEPGAVVALLTVRVLTPGGTIRRTPHTVSVSKDGFQPATRKLTAEETRIVEVSLGH